MKSFPAISKIMVFQLIFSFIMVEAALAQGRSPARSAPRTQEINFSEMSLDGKIRNPDGAFLVERQNIKFQPLYDIQKDFDEKIRESFHYVK